MRIALFNVKSYDKAGFEAANPEFGHELTYLETQLNPVTARLAEGHEAVCAFVNDDLQRSTVEVLAEVGVKLIVLRSAGFNHVDLAATKELGLAVARVPAYSPYAVAEHSVGLMLALNRKLHRAYNRVREHNFSLGGLLGFDMNDKTVGLVGTGKIGQVTAQILHGFGCRLLAHDPQRWEEGVRKYDLEYVALDDLFRSSDIISLHVPLLDSTKHIVDDRAVALMKDGVMLINTSRGGLVDTSAMIKGLKSQRIGALGLDVYEEEEELFFEDKSDTIITDDLFARLLTFPNVLITAHQGFFTKEAVHNIVTTTLQNAKDFESGGLKPVNAVELH